MLGSLVGGTPEEVQRQSPNSPKVSADNPAQVSPKVPNRSPNSVPPEVQMPRAAQSRGRTTSAYRAELPPHHHEARSRQVLGELVSGDPRPSCRRHRAPGVRPRTGARTTTERRRGNSDVENIRIGTSPAIAKPHMLRCPVCLVCLVHIECTGPLIDSRASSTSVLRTVPPNLDRIEPFDCRYEKPCHDLCSDSSPLMENKFEICC